MEGRVFIDGLDLYTTFGAFIVKDGYNGLLSYPSAKAVKSNAWAEEDGTEVDLSALRLDRKEFDLKFAFRGTYTDMEFFYDLLYSKPCHTFRFARLGLERKLRFISTTSLDYGKKMSLLVVKFSDDTPFQGFTYREPETTCVAPSTDYRIDGKPLTDYGVIVLKGSLQSVAKHGSAKTRLVRSLSHLDGAIVDEAEIPMKEDGKPIVLNCLLRAKTTDEAWRNYYGLLYDLVRAKEVLPVTKECVRNLTVGQFFLSYPCYYTKGSVESFSIDSDRIWIKFNITLQSIGKGVPELIIDGPSVPLEPDITETPSEELKPL